MADGILGILQHEFAVDELIITRSCKSGRFSFLKKHYFCGLLFWSYKTQESVLLNFHSQTPCEQTLSTGKEEETEEN